MRPFIASVIVAASLAVAPGSASATLSGCTAQVKANVFSTRCIYGSGLQRAHAWCRTSTTYFVAERWGSWVGVGGTSSAGCPTGTYFQSGSIERAT